MKKALFSILVLFSFTIIQAQTKTILLEEGFESGLPTTWNYYQYANPSIPWSTDNFAHSGQFCAIHDFNGSNNSDDWMVTPQLSITENGTNLSFWENIGFLDDYVLHEVAVSTGSGDPGDGQFTHILHSLPTGPESTWLEVVLLLDAFVGEDIYIAFRYTGLNADIWRIDDLIVDSPDYPNDMSVENIRPEFCLLNTSCTPTVTVKNVGQNIENNYSVNLTIDGTTYDETVTITDPISPAEKLIVEFPDWTPLNNINHMFNATLTLSGDANTSNNNLIHECDIFSSSDYTGESVYSIEYQQNKTFHLSTLTGDRTWVKTHPFSYPQELAAMTYMNGSIVAVQRDVCDVFVMSPSGDFYNVGNIDADYIHGIAYDEVNDILYGVGWPTYDWDDHLFIIDENWNLTDLGAFSNRSWIMGLAANGQGELYAISIDDGTLFTIDPATMQTTTIGDIDGLQYSMQIQDIGFDREKNDLYGTLALGVGQILAKIDTNDASLTTINNYGFDSSFGACAPIPSNPASIDSFENELFTIYPNPSNGIFTFTSENVLQGESLVEIIDVTGKRVYTFSFDNKLNSSVNIDLSNENSGIYFVKILNQNKCFTQKLIKQ